MSHLTEEAAKRVWFINLPEDVEPVTPQDRIAELERENAALRKDKERLELERCECLRTMDLALNSNEGLRQENAALRSAAVEVCALARVWVTVWGDKLSAESIQRLEQLEKQILKEVQP